MVKRPDHLGTSREIPPCSELLCHQPFRGLLPVLLNKQKPESEPLNLLPSWDVASWPAPQSLMVRVWLQVSNHINTLHTFTLQTDMIYNFSPEGSKKDHLPCYCLVTALLYTNKIINSVFSVTNSLVSPNVKLQRKKKKNPICVTTWNRCGVFQNTASVCWSPAICVNLWQPVIDLPRHA